MKDHEEAKIQYIRKLRNTLNLKKKQNDLILQKFKYEPPHFNHIKTHASFNQSPQPSITINTSIALKQKAKQYKLKPLGKTSERKGKKLPTLSIIRTLKNPAITNTMTFNEYVQLQSRANFKLHPKLGEVSDDLMTFINKVNPVRKQILQRDLAPLYENSGRYNSEIPEKDTKIKLQDKSLISHLWKNHFTLRDYQNFFLDELNGKISKVNYRIMLKKFRQISQLCFAKGGSNIEHLKYMKN